MRESKVYTTVIGTYKNTEELRRALQDGGCNTESVDALLPEIVLSPERIQLKIVVITVGDLGFGPDERVRRTELYKRARDLKLGLCPAEIAPQLWLQHKNRIDEQQLFIGMEPLGDKIFQVGRYGPEVFLSSWGADDVFFHLMTWAFVQG